MEVEDGFFKEEICTLTPDELFDAFLQSTNLSDTLDVFRKLCLSVDVNPRNHKTLYASLKSKLTSWKCKSLWTKIDKRVEHKDYKNRPCVKNKVLIIGAGPCGLRSAIESALLGAYVVVIEKRDRFSRNNVLHLWPFLIVDLKSLGAKKFFGQFCAGAIDHISKYFILIPVLYLLLKWMCTSGICIYVTRDELLSRLSIQVASCIYWNKAFSQMSWTQSLSPKYFQCRLITGSDRSSIILCSNHAYFFNFIDRASYEVLYNMYLLDFQQCDVTD